MITKAQAQSARNFEHVTLKNADGTPLRVRANGACKTWKTRPIEFRLPYKYGLYAYGYITERDAHNWNIAGEGN